MPNSAVKQQYEELPYPPRNPADEARRLVRTVGDDLVELNHHCFAGRRDFRRDFRCLVAGGGTGDSAIFLAEQLRDCNAEVVYLDLSEASRQVAEQRARVRGLTNIQWVTASLLDLPQLGLGAFDYINCSGVLHHLPEPKDGLACLAGALRDGGALYVMLYARYGRRGVYELQEILRTLLPADLPTLEKVKAARALLAQLPPTNYFERNRSRFETEMSPQGYGDAGLYDLLLHSQDRSYDVDAVYDLLGASGLQLVGFTGPQKRMYRPEWLLRDMTALPSFAHLGPQQRYAVAERLSGDITKHAFYANRGADCTARLDDASLCIVLTGEMKGMHEQLHQAIVPGQPLSITYTLDDKKEVLQLPGNAINKELFRYFDGQTSIEKMIRKVKLKAGNGNLLAIRSEIERAFELLHAYGWAYLAAATVASQS